MKAKYMYNYMDSVRAKERKEKFHAALLFAGFIALLILSSYKQII